MQDIHPKCQPIYPVNQTNGRMETVWRLSLRLPFTPLKLIGSLPCSNTDACRKLDRLEILEIPSWAIAMIPHQHEKDFAAGSIQVVQTVTELQGPQNLKTITVLWFCSQSWRAPSPPSLEPENSSPAPPQLAYCTQFWEWLDLGGTKNPICSRLPSPAFPKSNVPFLARGYCIYVFMCVYTYIHTYTFKCGNTLSHIHTAKICENMHI